MWSNATMRVGALMTNRVACIWADASMQQAAEIVALAGSSDLMVIEADRCFGGVLTEGDILRAALPDIDEILDAGGSIDRAFERFVVKARDLAAQPIAPLVIRDPIAVDPDDHVASAAVIMTQRHIRLLPVVRDGVLHGTVSRADICNAVVGELGSLAIHVG